MVHQTLNQVSGIVIQVLPSMCYWKHVEFSIWIHATSLKYKLFLRILKILKNSLPGVQTNVSLTVIAVFQIHHQTHTSPVWWMLSTGSTWKGNAVQYVQWVPYAHTHMHTWTCVVGVGASGNEPCLGMLRGKTVWEKPVNTLAGCGPSPSSFKSGFLLQDSSRETSVLLLQADVHTGTSALRGLERCLVCLYKFSHKANTERVEKQLLKLQDVNHQLHWS